MKRLKWISIILLALMFFVPVLEAQNSGRVSRGIPQATPDTNPVSNRFGTYGETMIIPMHSSKHALSDEGSYFLAYNTTVGTGIAQSTNIVAYADTAGAVGNYFYFKNNDLAGGKRMYLDYIKLLVTAVPITATSWQWALVLDYGTARYTSGGSAITPISPNGDSGRPSIVQMYAGALTTAVGINKRTVGRGTFRGVIPTVFDEFVIICGSKEGGSGVISAAASSRVVDIAGPIILGPGQNLTLIMWGAANASAPAFEFEVAWWER